MPKHDSRQKNPDFLRFRPLHAFTSAPVDQAKKDGRKVLCLLIGIGALIFAAAFVVLRMM